jgi:hypothetical protein
MRYWPWVLALLILILGEVALVVWLRDSRQTWIDNNSTPEVQASWQEWQKDAAKQDGKPGSGPVKRRTPSSSEPPFVVLLRDHFGVVQAAAVVFSAVLYLFGLILIHGLRQAQQNERSSTKQSIDKSA